jgi:dihydroxyacetone kinase-like protein
VAPPALVSALSAAAAALESSASELNLLDGYAGDGDMGITMAQAARTLRNVLATSEEMGTERLLSSCGAEIARAAPSTSGTLVATGFLRAAKAVTPEPGAGSGPVEAMERSFRAAMEGVQARGKASVGDRTLVDGLAAVCTSLERSVHEGSDVGRAVDAAAEAAAVAAAETAAMVPKIGRASWVPDRAAGHPDAGCTMLALVLRAAASSLGPP